MPRYFFDLYDDLISLDSEGAELPDLGSAERHALVEARQIIGATAKDDGKIDLRHNIKVRDEAGAIVHTLEFEDAVSVQRGGKPV